LGERCNRKQEGDNGERNRTAAHDRPSLD
jgi:hypothetical protein